MGIQKYLRRAGVIVIGINSDVQIAKLHISR